VKESSEEQAAFLKNELNLDSFREYLSQKFPNRPLEEWEDQARGMLDILLIAEVKTLRDLDAAITATVDSRQAVLREVDYEAEMPSKRVPSCVEAVTAIALTTSWWEEEGRRLLREDWVSVIDKHRTKKDAAD